MIARTEAEFNLFNRMDVARREYEALHGVGSGGDGANERRSWKLSNAAPSTANTSNKPITPRVKRQKKDSDNEDSTEQATKTSSKEK